MPALSRARARLAQGRKKTLRPLPSLVSSNSPSLFLCALLPSCACPSYHYDLNLLTVHGRSRFPGLFVWLRDGRKVAVRIPPGCLLMQVRPPDLCTVFACVYAFLRCMRAHYQAAFTQAPVSLRCNVCSGVSGCAPQLCHGWVRCCAGSSSSDLTWMPCGWNTPQDVLCMFAVPQRRPASSWSG